MAILWPRLFLYFCRTWFKIRGPFLGHRWRFWRCLKMVVWALFHAIYIMRNSYFSLSMQNQAIGKFSKKFLYLAPYPHIDFTIEAGKKFMSKKKPQEIGLLSSKKLSIGSFILLLGTFLCFHFFDFGPRQGVAFFLTFFWIFSGFPIANLFSQYRGLYLSGEIGFCFFVMGERSSFHWYLI